MNDRTAVQARGIQRAKSTRRGGPAGRQVVGEYVGQAAGDAAQAVRRAGLCPGLDRSFGCEPELIGLVVAQEPIAGGDLVRNGMVTLYVAAPGKGPLDQEPGASEIADEAPTPAPIASVPAEIEQLDGARRTRRKPGLARRATEVFDPPPAALPPEQEPAEEVAVPPARSSPVGVYAPDAEGLDECPLEERGEDESSQDDFVVHLDDVLAGRGGPLAWRRVYPRRRTFVPLVRGGGARVWIGEHSLLVKAVGAALAVWVLVGLASALNGQRPRSDTASVTSPLHWPARSDSRDAVSATSVARTRRAVRSSRVHTAAQQSFVQRRHRGQGHLTEASVPRERIAVQAPPAQPEASPAPARASPPPAAEQSQGGLFSP